ncbi:MAG: tRNA 2-thiouridine(34) synthase MnmA [Clostridia bacterium]|nr:tRNA 2-thiouridine(34) synthase MnmA [Clostridia bacterium]
MSSLTAKNNQVIVAMSGGVDSSVAAFLLLQKGYQVIGATIDTGYGQAPEQAALICRELGIEHQVIKARDIFEQRTIQPFAAAYLMGRTPNPCVDCNYQVKFPLIYDLAVKLGAAKIATGHYVRIYEQDGRYLLRRAIDVGKDQSYFLYRLNQELLSRCLFPLGEMSKREVRELAAEVGLASSRQKDSFDICFISGDDYREQAIRYAGAESRPGDIVDAWGRVLGRHQGLFNYTVGQRRGLSLSLGYPAYVLALDIDHNRLVVGRYTDLLKDTARVTKLNFLPFDQLNQPLDALVQIRYQAQPTPASIIPDAQNTAEALIRFERPVWAIAPGQSAVFYDGDLLLGGGYLI